MKKNHKLPSRASSARWHMFPMSALGRALPVAFLSPGPLITLERGWRERTGPCKPTLPPLHLAFTAMGYVQLLPVWLCITMSKRYLKKHMNQNPFLRMKDSTARGLVLSANFAPYNGRFCKEPSSVVKSFLNRLRKIFFNPPIFWDFFRIPPGSWESLRKSTFMKPFLTDLNI